MKKLNDYQLLSDDGLIEEILGLPLPDGSSTIPENEKDINKLFYYLIWNYTHTIFDGGLNLARRIRISAEY